MPSLGIRAHWSHIYLAGCSLCPLLLSENVPEVLVNAEGFHLEKVNAFINLPSLSAAMGLLPGVLLNRLAEDLELLCCFSFSKVLQLSS